MGVRGDGGQVIIPNSYSWFTDGGAINNRVSYDYNSIDSPLTFNHKMDHQKKWMTEFYNADGHRFINRRDDWPDPIPTINEFIINVFASPYILAAYPGTPGTLADYLALATEWGNTLAPGNNFNNYVCINDYPYLPALNNSQFGYNGVVIDDWNNDLVDLNQFGVEQEI